MISNKSLYSRWRSMMNRCYGSSHRQLKDYRDRGISVSNEFQDSDVYINYLKSLPDFGCNIKNTVDRIDNNKGYERGNLRWASRRTQEFNKRRKPKYGHRGIFYEKAKNLWVASVAMKNKSLYVGKFKDKHKAISARAEYVKKNNIKEG